MCRIDEVAKAIAAGVALRQYRCSIGAPPGMSSPPPFFHGFSTDIGRAAFEDACAKLDLDCDGPLRVGFGRRSLSGIAVDARGGRSWLKVTATQEPTNFFRDGEISAPIVDGLDRPAIWRCHDWLADGLHFRALQTSLTTSPPIELTPLAGVNAGQVSDGWIATFKEAVARLQATRTRRDRAPSEAIAEHVDKWFGPNAPCATNDYCANHGDANWSNLTSPNLSFLDWEVWGVAPRGFDLAYLLAFSCPNEALAARLASAFSAELATDSGKVSLLVALGEFLNLIHEGILPSSCEPFARRMASKLLPSP
jgi:hypothetical protein